jgi:selenocysteine lyase/cysteine desulfurase
MNTSSHIKYGTTEISHTNEVQESNSDNRNSKQAFAELKRGVYAALETYSNVHRGSGHNSMVTTHLFEQARDIVLQYLGLNKKNYVVIFCTPRQANTLMAKLDAKNYHCISSQDIGLSIGVRALAVNRSSLPKGIPSYTGGGTARLVSTGWVIWAKAPDKFEAGTPAIINIIAFAQALLLIHHFGIETFLSATHEKLTATEILYSDKLDKYTGRELLSKLRDTLIGRNISVPTAEGMKPYINLDNAASTRTFTPIWDAYYRAWCLPDQVNQEIIYEVKNICAKALGAPLADYDIIFTSNTTEGINLTAESMCKDPKEDIEPVVLNTLLEHNSNELPWRTSPGFSQIRLQVNADGFVDVNELETLLCEYNPEGKHDKKQIKLVAISGASNVLGTCNNLEEISRIVHRYGARLLVDAAQLVAHRNVEIEKCEIDFFAFSAHKVYAPFGSGALLVKKGLLNFNPAEMELIQSSGEENIAGIAALGKALMLLQRIGMDLIKEEEQILTKKLLHGLSQIPELTIYGIKEPTSPEFAHKAGVIVFNQKGIMANQVAKKLAERGGIGVRYGCHCSHLLIKNLLKIPPPLELFQGLIVTLFPQVALPGLTRVSLGIENSEEDIEILINMLGKIARQSGVSKEKPLNSPSVSTPILSQTIVLKQINDFIQGRIEKVYFTGE